MGNVLTLNNLRSIASSSCSSEVLELPQNDPCKRQKLVPTSCDGTPPRLIPSLPDEISIQIVARVPRIHYLNLKLVSRAWKEAIVSTELFIVRRELGTTEEWLYLLITVGVGEDKLLLYALDPLSGRWQRLPMRPDAASEVDSKNSMASIRMWDVVGSSIKIADTVRGWLGRKERSDQMSYCGSVMGAVDGRLYVLGDSKASDMSCVWCYDPILSSWSQVNPMSTGRDYCKTCMLNNKLYVVGGVSRDGHGWIPLESAEVFDPRTGIWSDIPKMPFSKAQVLPTAFLADLLKPTATGMTAYNGRLYVAQSLYCWPFFVDIGGEVYDPETNAWCDMPAGMGEGWPVRHRGTNLSITVENELYTLDSSLSLETARVKVYDYQTDSWRVVVGDVPIYDFTDSESPYLLAGLLGKLHVITKDANRNVTVLQVDLQNQLVPFSSSASSSSSSSHETSFEQVESSAGSETSLWRVIATMWGGSAELVSCQTIDL